MVCCTLALALCPALAFAQEAPTESQVKAAFVANFVKFIEWPADSFRNNGGHIRVCVLGEDRSGRELERIAAGKTVDGHALEVVRVGPAERIRGCHVLFVAASQAGGLRDTLAQIRGTPVLTVGDGPEFTRQGGIIRFFMLDNRVRFEINPEAAAQSGLKISSKLLALAQAGGRAGGG